MKRLVYGDSMERMREAWTDERLDDLNARVGELSRRVDEGFNRLDAKIDVRFGLLDDKVDSKFEGVYRLILGSAATVIATVLAGMLVDRL